MSIDGSKQIKIGAILSYLSIGINIIAGLLYTPWMIEQVGSGNYGLYTLANSLITLFMVDFGLSAATSRYISKYRAENNQQKIDDFLGAIYKLYLIIDIIIFTALLIFYLFLDSIYVKLSPEELEKFKVVYIIAASFAVVNFPFVTLNGILNAYEKFIQLKIADIIYRLLLVLITVVMLLCGYGLYALVSINAVVGLIVVIYKLVVISKNTPIKINWSYRERSLYRDVFGFSIWVTVASLAQRLIFNITPSVLGIVADSQAIAVFGIVVVIEGYTFTVTSAINGMFMPKISRIQENGSDIMPLMLNVGRFQYALNGLIVAGFFVIGHGFINLWMDPSYSDAYYGILLVIIPGLFFNSLEIANTAMVVQKKVKIQAYIAIVTGVTNIVLSLVLSSLFGVLGACISICIAYMVRSIAYIIVYRRVMHYDMRTFIHKCYVQMSVPILLSIAAGIIMNRLVEDSDWLSLGIKGFAVTLVYFVTLWFGALSKEDRRTLLQLKK